MLGNDHKLWSDRRKNAVVSENGRLYRATNSSDKLLACYQIDGGLIVEGIRCDFAITINDEHKIYFIELKGGDISHAADQILSTISKLNNNLGNVTLLARIVCSHVRRPNIRRPPLVRLEQLVARTAGNVRVSTRELEEAI
ncbi:hypothetical protein [Burkholderia gladioli]|uniref:hypothetical protein n=1 Tax=Burkholderia gladioli TaxID=28095 RepID=UPI00163E579C|nr:hypothetical protein [Burkholderia gladioli]